MNLEKIRPYLTYHFKSDSELLNAIELLSKNFTTHRSSIDQYLSDPKLVSAYTCFYLTTNIPKLMASIEKFDFSIDFEDHEWVDIGMGPGTFSMALLEKAQGLTIYGLEKSEEMVNQASKLISNLYPKADWSAYLDFRKIPKKQKSRIGVFGHSANEMPLDFIEKLINELELDEVMFIEPGTFEFFQKMRVLRSSLIDKEFNVLYPCPSSSQCPMPEDDWCHQYVKVQHDPSVERLTQMGKKDRRLLPLTLHYYSKNRKRTSSQSVITRVYQPTKFSCEWQVCTNCELKNVQIMFRGMKKAQTKELKEFLPGHLISFDIDKELEHNKVRGKLK